MALKLDSPVARSAIPAPQICCKAIESLVEHALLGRKVAPLFADMGAAWNALVTDCQLRWLGPEKVRVADEGGWGSTLQTRFSHN